MMSDELEGQLPAHFGGVPAVVKLISGDVIVAVVLYDDEQDTYVFDRPLVVTMRTDPEDETQSIMRFERWVPLSSNIFYTVYSDLIVTMAVVAQPMVSRYFKWADALYPVPEEDAQVEQSNGGEGQDDLDTPLFVIPDTSLTDDQRELHYMHLMMTHVPKTSPN